MSGKYISRFLLFFCLLIQVAASAQPAAVQAQTDAKKIMIGDQVRMFITARQDTAQGRLVWAVLPDTFNSLEIVEQGKIDTSINGSIKEYKQRLLITGFDSGAFTIPRFTFTSIPNSGNADTLLTDSFIINVQTVAVDTNKPFRGIKGIIEVKSTWKDYLWLIIAGVVLIALVIFVIYYFRKNKGTKAPVVGPPPKVETPSEKALRLLDELEQKQLWQKDEIKAYYSELTDILRIYIEERFRTPAMELTSDELLASVRTHTNMAVQHNRVASILNTADLAKFAKAQPLPQEHIEAMENTRKFVEETRPVDQPQNKSAS